MYVMAAEPCPKISADRFRSLYAHAKNGRELADAYALAHNQFWWVADDVYDYEEGTGECQRAQDIAHAWQAVMEEFEERIFCILRDEGVVIPKTGRIEVLTLFMKRFGYMDARGWWIQTE